MRQYELTNAVEREIMNRLFMGKVANSDRNRSSTSEIYSGTLLLANLTNIHMQALEE